MSHETENCVICQIINGIVLSSKVYEDNKVQVIMDIQPVNQGHLLVFPKEHASELAYLEPSLGAHMFKVAMKASESLRSSGVRCDGVNLMLSDGEVAGQDIKHVHLHVIPRYIGDGFGFKLKDSYWVLPDRSELDEVADKIAFT